MLSLLGAVIERGWIAALDFLPDSLPVSNILLQLLVSISCDAASFLALRIQQPPAMSSPAAEDMFTHKVRSQQ